MPKTPDEIKNGLASCVGCDNERPLCFCCSYKTSEDTPHCSDLLREDALALIQQLQAQNAEKDARIRQLEAERDAAVSDIERGSRCSVCKKFFKNGGECSGGVYCIPLNFEWRGVQKD